MNNNIIWTCTYCNIIPSAQSSRKCPRCGNENIKVLYEKEIDGNNVKICKVCNAQLKNIARKEARASKAAAASASSES